MNECGGEGRIEAVGVILDPDGKVKGQVSLTGVATPEQVRAVFGESVEIKDAGNSSDSNP